MFLGVNSVCILLRQMMQLKVLAYIAHFFHDGTEFFWAISC